MIAENRFKTVGTNYLWIDGQCGPSGRRPRWTTTLQPKESDMDLHLEVEPVLVVSVIVAAVIAVKATAAFPLLVLVALVRSRTSKR